MFIRAFLLERRGRWGCGSVCIKPQHHNEPGVLVTAGIPALGRWRQGNQKFKVVFAQKRRKGGRGGASPIPAPGGTQTAVRRGNGKEGGRHRNGRWCGKGGQVCGPDAWPLTHQKHHAVLHRSSEQQVCMLCCSMEMCVWREKTECKRDSQSTAV